MPDVQTDIGNLNDNWYFIFEHNFDIILLTINVIYLK